MGSNNKKNRSKEKESRKRRHRSRSSSVEVVRERERRRHHHKRHHKEKKHKSRHHGYDSEGSDIVIAPSPPRLKHSSVTPPPPPTITIRDDSSPEPNSHEANSAGAESLSIEETNKLRAKLGLKPLQTDTVSTSADGKKKDDLGEFYHKPAGNIRDQTQQEKYRMKLNERKEKRLLEEKLKRVKTLADDDSEDDAESWVDKSRRIQKEKDQAAKRAKLLEELDQELGVGQLVDAATREQRQKVYNQKDLVGVRVEHDSQTFKEGTTVVLTLKDQEVLATDEDVLVNVNMIDDERYKKNIERKKQKPTYNPYDDMDQQLDEYGNPKPKELLGKYDEEIGGEKKKSFAIGMDDDYEASKRRIHLSIKAKLENKRLESLILPEPRLASEYYSEEELTKFKKPKKKVRKIREKGKILKAEELESQLTSSAGTDYLRDLGTRRKKNGHEADTSHFMEIDDVPDVKHKEEDVKIEPEDNELELALHRARKLKALESKVVIAPVDFVKIEPVEQESNSDDLGSIVLNSTAEFCRTLGDIPTYGRAGNRDEEEDLLDFERDLDSNRKLITSSEDSERISSWNAVDMDRAITKAELAPPETPILDEEPDVGAGVAAALRLAMSKGYLDKDDTNRPSTSRLAHLQAKNYSIEDKSHGDDDKFGRRDRYSGPLMDFKEKDAFKPNVKLDYIDDEGRVLNAKEAFRYLSHKFHGKGPGKNKIEKRIKKNEQEGLMKKMSSTDTPLGTLNMLQAKQKETASPFIVLSGSKSTNSAMISKIKL